MSKWHLSSWGHILGMLFFQGSPHNNRLKEVLKRDCRKSTKSYQLCSNALWKKQETLETSVECLALGGRRFSSEWWRRGWLQQIKKGFSQRLSGLGWGGDQTGYSGWRWQGEESEHEWSCLESSLLAWGSSRHAKKVRRFWPQTQGNKKRPLGMW